MGTRYFLTLDCPHCGETNENVWYAPTCDATTWICDHCSHRFDIEQFFKVSVEEASNAEEIKIAMDCVLKGRKSVNRIEQPMENKTLDEMSEDELRQIVLHTRDKLDYCQLKRKSLGWRLSEFHMRQGILRHKLKVLKQAMNILKRFCNVGPGYENTEEEIRKLRRVAQPILNKWNALK